ncbi:hypothetical protein [Futiania mangrovi]|uniref:Uncharacterized protein n=1 Tax=Futiania mangrovi TaxID=2959716 RepID=A0A9J6PPC7_9PROT|nr:hypothetical protein [Futiania mangrovii]MCP1337954.1 hypothetical protein [Futiania mangrovii]
MVMRLRGVRMGRLSAALALALTGALAAGAYAAEPPAGVAGMPNRPAAIQPVGEAHISGTGPAAIVGFAPGSAEVPPAGVRVLSLFAARVRDHGGPVVVLHEDDGSGLTLEMARVRQVRDLLSHLGVEVADSPPESASGLVIVVTGTLGGY